MVFCSVTFLFYFLPAVLVLYYLLVRAPNSVRSLVLTLASYCFYGWWRLDFILLIVLSTVVDFVCGRKVYQPEGSPPRPGRKRWVWLSVTVNLGLLAYFKYANFVVENLNWVRLGWGGEPWAFEEVILPVGISFYTFQTMSYTLDVYRGRARPARSFLDLAAYVALFPQLVAGPIVRYHQLAEQLVQRRHSWEKIGRGAHFFMLGFAKKVLLADGLGVIADEVFERAAPGFCQSGAGTVAYTLQLYFDFSGYSDMAVGLGYLFGFRFPCNFYSPYRSESITEFWRRWHITLSAWLRDYLYIPLGGNRRGPWRTYFNLTLTMVLGGLWHGAQYTFVLWGLYHGLLLALERLLGKRSLLAFLPRPGRILGTFLLTMLGWVVFRAPDLETAGTIYQGLFGFHGLGSLDDALWATRPVAWWQLGTGLLMVFLLPNTWQQIEERPARGRDVLLATLFFLAAVVLLLVADSVPFLYFQF